MIYKGLDDEEAQFLHFVMQREAEQASQRWEEEVKEVTAYRVSRFFNLILFFSVKKKIVARAGLQNVCTVLPTSTARSFVGVG